MNSSTTATSAWDRIWSLFGQAGLGPLFTALAVLGFIIVVIKLVQFFWGKAMGRGGSVGKLIGWPLIIGAILMAPGVIFPALAVGLDMLFRFIGFVFQFAVGR